MKKVLLLCFQFCFVNLIFAQSLLLPGGVNNILESENDEIIVQGSNIESNGSQFKVVFSPPEVQPEVQTFIRDTENSSYRFINMFLGNQSYRTNDNYNVKGDISIPSSIGHDTYGGWNSIFSISDGNWGWTSNYTVLDFYMKRVNEGGWKAKFFIRFIYKRNGNIIERKTVSTQSNFELSSNHDWEILVNPAVDPTNWIIKVDGNVEPLNIVQNEVNGSIDDNLIVENYISLGANNHTQYIFNGNNNTGNGNHSVLRLNLNINGQNILDEDDIWNSPLATVISNINESPEESGSPTDPIESLVDCEVSALKNITHIPGSFGWVAFYAKQGAAEKAGVFDGDVAINGKITTKEIKVTTSTEEWPDYVFEENYPLSDLKELEAYIIENKHLPQIPDAKVIKEEGYSLSELDAKLLEKIEELTLYIIEQEKEIESQKEENQEQEKKINYLMIKLKELGSK